MHGERPKISMSNASPMRLLASVIGSAAAGALAGGLLWVILLYLRLGVHRISPHYGRILSEMARTMSFGSPLIIVLGAANGFMGFAQFVMAANGTLPAVSDRKLLFWAFLADFTLLLLSATLLDYGVMFVGAVYSVVFHLALIAMILSRRRLRFSHFDAVYIVLGAIINLVVAGFFKDWIEATR